MRGFRGSRAAQSFNSRAERSYQRKTEREEYLRMVEQRQQPKPQPQLPDWLKGLAQPLAQPDRKELPPNVIPITAAKKRLAARAKPKPAAPRAKSTARAAASFSKPGAGKLGNPWARLIAPCSLARRVIPRITDSVNPWVLTAVRFFRA